MPPAELSLFASARRQCCKSTHTHTHSHMWPPTLTARIVHTAHSSWPRTTNALATPPRTVPLSFCTTRPAAMLRLRAFAFVFRSCDKRRQLTLSRTLLLLLLLLLLRYQFDLIATTTRRRRGEERRATVKQASHNSPSLGRGCLCCSAFVLCIEREWERARALCEAHHRLSCCCLLVCSLLLSLCRHL